jgi:non-homologous end joining protein Ku
VLPSGSARRNESAPLHLSPGSFAYVRRFAYGTRANWNGFLRLSLVTCPIALYPATSDADFNQINDPRYVIRPYYIVLDGKVGHDAFAVIRETIRTMNKVAIERVVLTSRGSDGRIAALPIRSPK